MQCIIRYQTKKYKTIILISDGEDHDEKSEKILTELQDNGVIVHTIGIGSPEGAPIFDPAVKDYKKDETGATVVSKLNQQDLQAIATQTGGLYQLYSTSDQVVNNIIGAIDNMEKKHITGSGIRTYSSYYQWFLLVAFLLVIV